MAINCAAKYSFSAFLGNKKFSNLQGLGDICYTCLILTVPLKFKLSAICVIRNAKEQRSPISLFINFSQFSNSEKSVLTFDFLPASFLLLKSQPTAFSE